METSDIISFILLLIIAVVGVVFVAKKSKKFDLVKIAGIMVLFTVALTWIIPQGYFSGAAMQVEDITRVGITDFFTYGLLGMYYFTVLVTFLFVLGGFYQVLSRIGGYQKFTTNIAKISKGKEIAFTLVTSFLIALVSAVTNEYILVLAFIPLIINIMSKMGFDKITKFTTTFGSVLVGTIGSIYSTKIIDMNINYLNVPLNDTIWYRVALFVLAYGLFNLFVLLHLRKAKKVSKANEEVADLFEEGKATKRKVVWPVIVVLALFFAVALLAYFPWESVCGITWFATATEDILAFKLLDTPIFSYLFGNMLAFGAWDILGIQALMIVTSLILKWIYGLSFDDYLESFGEGFKKASKLVLVLLLAYLTLEFTVMYPVLPTIVDWFTGALKSFTEWIAGLIPLTDKFTLILSSITGVFSSLFTVEYQYTVNLVGTYFVTTFADYANAVSIMLQSTFGLASMFAPSSAILLIGLSYLGITYKEWFKYIWKFLLAMFGAIIAILIIMLVI